MHAAHLEAWSLSRLNRTAHPWVGWGGGRDRDALAVKGAVAVAAARVWSRWWLLCGSHGFCVAATASGLQAQRMKSLLRNGDPDARVVLLLGFYEAGLRLLLETEGFEVIMCDYRYSEAPGMHYLGDARDILWARVWTAIIASPPCKNIAWSSASLFQDKITNGNMWFAISFAKASSVMNGRSHRSQVVHSTCTSTASERRQG